MVVILILGKLGQYTEAKMKKYLDNKDKCRCVELFKNFIMCNKIVLQTRIVVVTFVIKNGNVCNIIYVSISNKF